MFPYRFTDDTSAAGEQDFVILTASTSNMCPTERIR
jgi:hypothetical protein